MISVFHVILEEFFGPLDFTVLLQFIEGCRLFMHVCTIELTSGL